jgi:hypothetical protein
MWHVLNCEYYIKRCLIDCDARSHAGVRGSEESYRSKFGVNPKQHLTD